MNGPTSPRLFVRPAAVQSVAAWREWWLYTTAANRLRVQLGTFAIVCLVAFHYSLSTLVSNLQLSTPLAYIGLVPAIALSIAALQGRAAPRGPDIHDRQLDWIVGIPLIGAALVIELLIPIRVSAMFWVWRLDLVALPLFVAGVVALLFGTRTLWRQKFAVGYLFLAWPLPYMLVLLRALNGFTDLTLSALRQMVKVVPVAKPISGADGSLFQVTHHGSSFPLSVVSACSGVDSVFGFLLVGSALALIVRGPRLRRGVWLAGGMLLLWGINVGRIMFIFWAGQTWGEHFAIRVLHPFIGLLTFSFGVVLMLLVMPLLGLHLVSRSTRLQPPNDPQPAKLPVTNVLPAIAVLIAASLVLGINNTSLRAYDLVASSSGEARLASYSLYPASPSGWSVDFLTSYNWARPYFGDDSTWLRYEYYRDGPGGNLNASVPVTADVVDTTSLSSFSAYGVEACYNFHGYSMRDVASVNLPGGIRGQSLSYTTGGHGSWTIVYWIMPVKTKAGGPTHYERVILYVQDITGTSIVNSSAVPSMHSLQNALNPRSADDRRLIAERAFLASFAREVILGQTRIAPGTVLTIAHPPDQQRHDSSSSVALPAASGPVTASPTAGGSSVTQPTGIDQTFVHLLRGNVELARRYAAMTPLERIRWRAAAPQLFAGD